MSNENPMSQLKYHQKTFFRVLHRRTSTLNLTQDKIRTISCLRAGTGAKCPFKCWCCTPSFMYGFVQTELDWHQLLRTRFLACLTWWQKPWLESHNTQHTANIQMVRHLHGFIQLRTTVGKLNHTVLHGTLWIMQKAILKKLSRGIFH